MKWLDTTIYTYLYFLPVCLLLEISFEYNLFLFTGMFCYRFIGNLFIGDFRIHNEGIFSRHSQTCSRKGDSQIKK